MKDHHHHQLTLEVTVISAHSLKNRSTFLYTPRLRSYVTLEEHQPPPGHSTAAAMYRTRVDDKGGANPTWSDTIRLPLDPSFLRDRDSSAVDLRVLSDRPLQSPARLGWFRIKAYDVVDGFRPIGMARRLSYALRSFQHGGRGHGVVDVAVLLVGPAVQVTERALPSTPVALVPSAPFVGWSEVAIGIPVVAGSWEFERRLEDF